jgi:hypothetical protein
MIKLALTAIALSCALAACGDNPVSFSAPVGITLKAKSGDVAAGTIRESKDIPTESGNPYGAFINDAMAKLGGKAPSSIEVNDVTLTLEGTSTGVATLDKVFTGDVDVSFQMNSGNATYDVAHAMNPTTAGPFDMTVAFDYSKVAPADKPGFLTGAFKVILSGPAATTFAAAGASADLQVTFTFDALQ